MDRTDNNKILTILIAVMLTVGMTVTPLLSVFAEEGDSIPGSDKFPDKNFRKLITEKVLELKDEELEKAEKENYPISKDNLTRIANFSDSLEIGSDIEDITGIREFKAISELNISGNHHITKLEINPAEMPNLETVSITGNNNLKTVNLTGEVTTDDGAITGKIKSLTIDGDEITSINCSKNLITKLNISETPKLETLNCSDNKLESLVVQNASELAKLEFNNNSKLKTFEVSGGSKVKNLIFNKDSYPELESLKIEGNENLNGMELNGFTYLKTVDLSNNLKMGSVNIIRNNNLTDLNLSKNRELTTINCNNNKVSNLNIDDTPKVKEINLSDNALETLEISGRKNLKNLNCTGNGETLTSLIIKGNDNLNELKYAKEKEPAETFQNLENLEISDTKVAQLDLSRRVLGNLGTLTIKNNSNLTGHLRTTWEKNGEGEDAKFVEKETLIKDKKINLSDYKLDKLSTVTMTGNHKIESINLSKNPSLKTVDLSKNDGLTTIDCSNFNEESGEASGRIKDLNASQNKNLRRLNCSGNQLEDPKTTSTGSADTGLNISATPNLETLICKNNKLTGLNLRNRESLKELDCSNNQIKDLKNDDHGEYIKGLSLEYTNNLEKFICNGNKLTKLPICGKSKLQVVEIASNELKGDLRIGGNNFNNLTKLDLSGNHDLDNVEVSNNKKLNNLNLSNMEGLKKLKLENLEALKNEIKKPDDTDENKKTEKTFNLDGTTIEDAEIKNTGLEELELSEKGLKRLIVEGNDSLRKLNCSKNELNELKLNSQSNKNLKTINCSNNKLKSLAVWGNPQLETLECNNNSGLREIILSKNKGLKTLHCQDCTNLRNLNLADAENLKSLNCSHCGFTSIDLNSNINPDLTWSMVNNRWNVIDGCSAYDVLGSSAFLENVSNIKGGELKKDDKGVYRFYFSKDNKLFDEESKLDSKPQIITYDYLIKGGKEDGKTESFTLVKRDGDYQFFNNYKQCRAVRINPEDIDGSGIQEVITNNVSARFEEIEGIDNELHPKIVYTADFSKEVFDKNFKPIKKPNWVNSSYEIIVPDNIKPKKQTELSDLVITDDDKKGKTPESIVDALAKWEKAKNDASDKIIKAKTPKEVDDILAAAKKERDRIVKDVLKNKKGGSGSGGSGSDGSGSDGSGSGGTDGSGSGSGGSGSGGTDGSGSGSGSGNKGDKVDPESGAYRFTEGGGQIYKKGKDSPVRFATNGPSGDLMSIWITTKGDDIKTYNRLHPDRYKVESDGRGGTRLTIDNSMLDNLDDGDHGIKAMYMPNEKRHAEALFKVKGKGSSSDEKDDAKPSDKDDDRTSSSKNKDSKTSPNDKDKKSSKKDGSDSGNSGSAGSKGSSESNDKAAEAAKKAQAEYEKAKGTQTIRTGDDRNIMPYVAGGIIAAMGVVGLAVLRRRSSK